MISSSQRPSHNFAQIAAVLFGLAIGSAPVCALVEVQGNAPSVQVVAHHAQLSEVLVALSAQLAFATS
jgi:hypothetical protein